MFEENPTKIIEGEQNGLRNEEKEETAPERQIVPPKKLLNFNRPITEAEKIVDIEKAGQTTLQREIVVYLRRISRNLDILVLFLLIFFAIWTSRNISNSEVLLSLFSGIVTLALTAVQLLIPKGKWAERTLSRITKKNLDDNYRTIME
jgi:hypothetical protein